MKASKMIAAGLLLGTVAWTIHRNRKYPLEKGYPLVNLFTLPKGMVSSNFAAFGNRQLQKRKLPPAPTGVSRHSIWIPSKDGVFIQLSIYETLKKDSQTPCLIYFHGGGFCFSDAGYIHKNVADYARFAKCKVVFVHYRTADQYAFPIPFEDCRIGLQYVWENSHLLGIDRNRIAVGGDSAGGALAAACTLWARDETTIKILFQMLLYPVTDSRMETVSMKKFTDSPLWNAKLNRKMWQVYLRNGCFECPAYASPMRAANFSALPKAYVEVEEFDCLHDEGLAYAKALIRAGIDVQIEDIKGTFHGFDMFRNAKKSKEMMKIRSHALYKAFWPSISG